MKKTKHTKLRAIIKTKSKANMEGLQEVLTYMDPCLSLKMHSLL